MLSADSKWLSMMLSPFAPLYFSAAAARNWLYDTGLFKAHTSALPVVCAGNVTAGGSGKSPFITYLAAELQKRGGQPAVLSRGYGGRLRGPHLVGAIDTSSEVGDEPLMHCLALVPGGAVVVAKDRVAGARFIEQRGLADIILLDDGYQHRRLARDANLLLLDVSTPEREAQWKNGKPLPLGRLRESLAAAVRRATVIVFIDKSGGETTGERVRKLRAFLAPKTCLQFNLRPALLRDTFTGEELAVTALRGEKVRALTAIAHPQSFFATVASCGFNLELERSFPDHYVFKEEDLAEFCDCGAPPLIVTTKDAVKLRQFTAAPRQIFSLELSGTWSTEEEEECFWEIIERTCSRKIENTSRVAGTGHK